MDPKLGLSLGGLSFSLCSIFGPAFPINRNNSGLKFLKMGGWMVGVWEYPLRGRGVVKNSGRGDQEGGQLLECK